MPMKAKKTSLKAAASAIVSASTSSAHVLISTITADGNAECVSSLNTFDFDDEENANDDDDLLQWKPPRHRSNTKQIHEKREAMLCKQRIYSLALTFGTILLAHKNKKENGMSSRKVAALGTKRFKGIGPSHTTNHQYVINLGLIGVSPLKTGPQRNILSHDYKALCAAFASYMRSQQLTA